MLCCVVVVVRCVGVYVMVLSCMAPYGVVLYGVVLYWLVFGVGTCASTGAAFALHACARGTGVQH